MRILLAPSSRTRARVGARTESPTMMSSMKSAARQALHALALLLLLLSVGAPAQAANNAAFVSQSVPATMAPGATYTATVVMANTGTTTWKAAALHGLGAQNPQDNFTWLSTNRAVLSGPVAPGQNATFVFQVTAPATVGTYNFQWKMVQDFVEWFGALTPNVAVVVRVPPPKNDSQVIGVSVPSGITQGQSYTVGVTMKNVGTTTWTAGGNYNLGSANPQDNNVWGVQRSPVTGSVAPGQQITFALPVVAPAAGSYTMSWAMVQDFVEWFGPASSTAVTVNPPAAPVPTMGVSRNPSPMTAGQGFTLSWSSTNATAISRVCTTNGTGYTVNDAPALNGSSSGTASAAWVNNASNCVWRATGAGGTAIFTETMTTNAAPTPAPTMSVSRTPSPMTAGQAFTLTWGSTNATSVSRVCTAGGSGYTVNDAPAINGSSGGTASAGWVNNPSSCVWRATGAGGTATFNETMTTNAGASVEVVTYIHTDGLGSPVARSNASGQLVGNKTRYEPYGLTAAGDTPTIGFTGHVNDADTGLVYMQQRYYDPVAGRFLSIDPVTTDANTGGSFNRYFYVQNNPYKHIDPDGRDTRDYWEPDPVIGRERNQPNRTCEADCRYGFSPGNASGPTTEGGNVPVPTGGGLDDSNNPIKVLWDGTSGWLKNAIRGPDYVAIQVNFYVLSGGKSMDLSTGKTYASWSLGRSYPGYSIKPGFSIVAGSINNWSPGDTHGFLTGGGNAGSAFIPLGTPWIGAGGGWSHSYGGKTAIEYGFGTPGAGVSPVGYGWESK